ncbi:hypothetical protein FPSE_04028 [Fusarium pseudograminearum CS3096]|uniref:Uncharacterized protein n=1 Tax=Fusarium pseudograminearum (strain CS3096) TaxID=1028729 RepID=K3VPX4_FUSPC|nr:hypothetical protein FPSE_04028 [Fusarium pseudograminearum CS3096]EKJ75848.1 hypothetical protein FPSE_04028 [Fusarium pseudograminearum CS3096]
MGTGKTKTFASIKMRHNPLKQQLDELNSDPEFDKLSPEDKIESATIIQTVRESIDNFPDFRNLVFYSTASVFPIKVGVEVNEKGRIHSTIGLLEIYHTLQTLDVEGGEAISLEGWRGDSKHLQEDEAIPGEGGQRTGYRNATGRYTFVTLLAPPAVQVGETSLCYRNAYRQHSQGSAQPADSHRLYQRPCPQLPSCHLGRWIFAGLYHDSYDPDADKTDITAEFGEKLGQTVGIFSEAFVAKHQENSEVTAALQFFKMAHDRWSLKPWMLSPNLLVDSSKELSWGVNLGSKVTYPSDGMLPSSIRIEECPYRPGNPDAELLRRIGKGYADSLFSSAEAGLEQSTRAVPDPSQPADSNDLGLHDGTESHMNFGEHRAGVITAFDPGTIMLLQPTTPAFFGTNSKLIKEIAGLASSQGAQMTPSRKKHLKKLQSGSEVVGLGVEHIDKLLKESKNVDTPWIQNYVIVSLVLYGYNVATSKSTVRWFLLKTPNTYHDNIERMVTAKWIVTTSTQSALPEWLEFELLEICLCEIHKSIWHTPFNRYAWIIEKELSGSSMNYHGTHIRLLGHIFSMIARCLLTCPEDQQKFWKDLKISGPEKWLMEDADKLRTKFFKVTQTVLNTMKKEPDSADAELKHKLGKAHLSCTTRRTKATTVTLKEDESEDEFLKISLLRSLVGSRKVDLLV